MSKQFSIAALQQQLAQLETLRNDQLNGLLNRLRNYKLELPVEDHPIIDWGINAIKAKMQEKEQLMNEIWEELRRKYGDYSTFIHNSGWQRLDLNSRAGKQDLSNSIRKYLDDIVLKSCLNGDGDQLILKRFVPTIRSHLYRFCSEKENQEFAKDLINKYVVFYQERSIESSRRSASMREERHTIQAIHYKITSDLLKMSW